MMNRTQLLNRLRKVQGKERLEDFAEQLGISGAYLSLLYSGKRKPGKKILNLMSLKQIVSTSVLYAKKGEIMETKDTTEEVRQIVSSPLVGSLHVKYVAVRKAVMYGVNCVCVACSHQMAKRLAKLLNQQEGEL